jgi:hypothetical protein
MSLTPGERVIRYMIKQKKLGNCITCGKQRVVGNKNFCGKHREIRRKSQRRLYTENR